MSKSVAIVTGASSGIGKATALRLARDFGAIVLAARSGEKLGEAGREIEAIGAEPLVLELDLTPATAAEIVVNNTLERFGRIDALVNIAGAVAGLDVFQMTDEQWNSGMELKFHAARRLTIRAWEALKTSKGSVVFISGNAAVIPKANAAAVGAINAAIEALAKAFADRGIADGVQVNSVSPGAIMTGRRLAMLEKAGGTDSTRCSEHKHLKSPASISSVRRSRRRPTASSPTSIFRLSGMCQSNDDYLTLQASIIFFLIFLVGTIAIIQHPEWFFVRVAP
jgi:3-oxoacyl-[acyl-carrier protein] reductase